MNSGDRDRLADDIPTDVEEDKPVLVERRRSGLIIGPGIFVAFWSIVGLTVWRMARRW